MFGVTLLLLSVGCISANRFSIMAPNVFHVGVIENVSITIFNATGPVNVTLSLRNYIYGGTPFYQVHGLVEQGGNIFLPVKVETKDVPLQGSVDKRYVYLVAKSDDPHFQFKKTAKILLSYRDGMVFIQTDKPIYTPKQNVLIRVIPVEFDMKPSRRKITVEVLNPQGIKVVQWKDQDTRIGTISKMLNGNLTFIGNWTIYAVYGHEDTYNTSVKFEVKEYVLPKFSVKLNVPSYILNSTDLIKIGITTRYTYGKPVLGTASVSLSVLGLNGTIVPFAKHYIVLHKNGVTTLLQRIQIIQDLPGNLWFPEKSRLQVKVDVIERATGNKESAVDKSCQFTSSPYLIEFKNTPKYFKPGLRFGVKVVVTYPNKQPAKDVSMLISAMGVKSKESEERIVLKRSNRNDDNTKDVTNELGEAYFNIDACSKCPLITIQVKTDDGKLNDSQNAVANYLVKQFHTENGPFILVRQFTQVGKVGQKMNCETVRSENDRTEANISFAVISRGRILSHSSTEAFDGMFKTWSFFVTSQMSPSARLVAYYITKDRRVVADSILLNIEDTLPTKVDFAAANDDDRQLNKVKKRPGVQYLLQIKASPGTRLGLLGVDESVYLLRNENRLTKDRILKATEELDLGCGVGGGSDSRDIFKNIHPTTKFKFIDKNAGIVLMTDDFVIGDRREGHGCDEDLDTSRRKRSAEDDLEDKICCDMAKDNGNVTCGKLSIDSNKALSKRCRLEFWKCCTRLYGMKDTALMGRSGQELEGFIVSDDEFLEQTQVRSFFPETWIYAEKVVGPSGLVTMNVTLPDTITTWVMQAVAINNKTGLGLATPLRILASRKYFISLKMPYSVKKGEQVSLLVTVFNYDEGENEIRAKLFLKGDKDFCSTAVNGKRALIGLVRVPPNDARSVAIPIVPKRTGEFEIEVSSIIQAKIDGSYMNSAGDAVKRKLLVVPEGKEHRKSTSFILDPSGSLNDSLKSDSNIPGPDGPLQFYSIELKAPDNAIRGSVGAEVHLTGNLLGPVINVTLEGGMDRFFRKPYGCGEQNMYSSAPNIYALEYLLESKQLTAAQEEIAYYHIQYGYGRQLKHRHIDHSFSVFRDRPGMKAGSTWLTAFVMRVFCKANQFTGVNIDEKLICESVNYLMQSQREDGALIEALRTSSYLVGGAYSEGDVSMTAFILLTLAECKCKGVNSETVIRKAKGYLENQYSTLNTPYSMALTAYALSLVNSEVKILANNKLVQNAVFNSTTNSRYWNAGKNSLNVETAGYALLTQIVLGRIGYAGPIVTYLINQKKSGMGFVSTQDTVVALQALALYSKNMPDRPQDLRVALKSEREANWKAPIIRITKENALLRRKIDVKRFVGGKLFVETQGTGVGQLEVEIRYNLPTSRDEICKFDLNAEVSEIEDNSGELFGLTQSDAEGDAGVDKKQVKKKKANKKKKGGKKRKAGCKGKNKKTKKCRGKGKKPKNKKKPKHQPVKSIHLKVCTRYREQGNTSMAIMDIGILTGFKPDQKSLKKLDATLENELGMIEVSDRSLVLYFNEIPSHRELCVDVQFDREYYVGVVQAVPVNVYDYYEPDESCSKFYGPPKSSTLRLGVCDVGSESCKCSQENCAEQDPSIGDIDKLIKRTCKKYHYAIKGKVLLVDEQNTMLAYLVEVVDIIQQGNKDLNVTQHIELWKRAACHSPHLDENKEYLFMGLDEGDRYDLDKTSFVKRWPEKDTDTDRQSLENFLAKHRC